MTPLQELLNYTTDLLHTFDSEERVAMAVLDYLKTNKKAMLEKEAHLLKNRRNCGKCKKDTHHIPNFCQ